eukprot:SAG11_NODE_5142_length_1652_cov_1.830650_2_plen_115_part_00
MYKLMNCNELCKLIQKKWAELKLSILVESLRKYLEDSGNWIDSFAYISLTASFVARIMDDGETESCDGASNYFLAIGCFLWCLRLLSGLQIEPTVGVRWQCTERQRLSQSQRAP